MTSAGCAITGRARRTLCGPSWERSGPARLATRSRRFRPLRDSRRSRLTMRDPRVRVLLQEPKSPGREHLRTVGPQVDEPDTPRVAIDGVDDAPQDRLKRLTREGMPEISDREIVGHRELLCVGDHDLDVRASVLMPSGRQIGARDLGQGGGDLDADHAPEGAFGRLVDDSTLAASEVDEGVAIGDAQEAEGSGQHPPGRCHVVPVDRDGRARAQRHDPRSRAPARRRESPIALT